MNCYISTQKNKKSNGKIKSSSYETKASTLGAILPNNNLKSFSKGVRFKSIHKTFTPFDFFSTTGALETTGTTEENPVSMAALCRLIWPPKAWPIANSNPHMEHSCIFGLPTELRLPKLVSLLGSSLTNLGFLWLARWPPSAWNDVNLRLQVLHSNTSAGADAECFVGLVWRPWESIIRHWAMSKLCMPPSSSLVLFMNTLKGTLEIDNGKRMQSVYAVKRSLQYSFYKGLNWCALTDFSLTWIIDDILSFGIHQKGVREEKLLLSHERDVGVALIMI